MTYLLYVGLVFVAVLGLSLTLMRLLLPDPVQQRMQGIGLPQPQDEAASAWVASVARLTGPFARLSVPEEGWENSPMRTRFMNAGLRNANAARIFFSTKTILAVALPLVAWLVAMLGNIVFKSATTPLFILLAIAALGFYLPNAVLAIMIRKRQRDIVDHFPDALDLLTVCVEAGLAIDASITRISDEMGHAAPALAEEMHLVTLDLRAGSSKERALRNLAIRTGVEEIDSLVAMLVQAERFGTSIGDSLRVHSDALRTRRRQRAEEAAAKISLKLLFPLIFCIFPAILLVLLGPAMMQLMKLMGSGGHLH